MRFCFDEVSKPQFVQCSRKSNAHDHDATGKHVRMHARIHTYIAVCVRNFFFACVLYYYYYLS